VDRQINDGRITFACENCGVRLTVPSTHAGKAGRCPTCGQLTTVRSLAADNPVVGTAEAGKSTPYDTQLLDISKRRNPPATRGAEPDAMEEACERMQAQLGGRLSVGDDETPQRRLPWIIDIFLYPLNKAGLTILLIAVGVPSLLRIALRFFRLFSGAFPPVLIFWVLFIVLHWAAVAMFALYMNWYVCECIRDSAEGGIRAAETAAATPGFWEIIIQAAKVAVAALLCMAPALIYLNETRRTDQAFGVLYGAGGFVFPMALLAMVMFDGLHALNPILLIGSILRTLFHYCILVPFCYVLCLLVPIAGYYLVKRWMLGSALLFFAYYQLLVLGHLLGRFYWRNKERLNWDT
jgi:hypothetical protein